MTEQRAEISRVDARVAGEIAPSTPEELVMGPPGRCQRAEILDIDKTVAVEDAGERPLIVADGGRQRGRRVTHVDIHDPSEMTIAVVLILGQVGKVTSCRDKIGIEFCADVSAVSGLAARITENSGATKKCSRVILSAVHMDPRFPL